VGDSRIDVPATSGRARHRRLGALSGGAYEVSKSVNKIKLG
jgi:hypothetical protein